MMRALDVLRAMLVSPELACVLIPFGIYMHAPWMLDVLVAPMQESVVFALGPAATTLAMLAFNYRESLQLLSPFGQGKVLLDWPGYPMIKNRVLIALGWCVIGLCACSVGAWMITSNREPLLAVAITGSGLMSSGAATVTIGLARFRLREVLTAS
jgi:hypothetical protein